MMRRLRLWRWWAALWATPVMALSIELPLADRAQFDLEQGLREAVVRVAEQLTGIAETQLVTQDPGLFALPESLVFSYGFTENGFLVDVDDQALTTRLTQASIPLWSQPRPATLVWLTEERGLERRMLVADESALAASLEHQFLRFDVPVRFVLMDLEDQLALSPAEIWGGFDAAVTGASARYVIPWVMVLGDRPLANETRYWLYRDGQKVMDTVVSGDLETRVRQISQDVFSRLRVQATVTAVVPAERDLSEKTAPVAIRLLEVDSLGLLALMTALEADPRVTRIAPMTLMGDSARLVIEGSLDVQAVTSVLQTLDGLVEVEPGSYRWQ